MVLNCRKIGQIDPFKGRVVFLDTVPDSTPTISQRIESVKAEITAKLNEGNETVLIKVLEIIKAQHTNTPDSDRITGDRLQQLTKLSEKFDEIETAFEHKAIDQEAYDQSIVVLTLPTQSVTKDVQLFDLYNVNVARAVITKLDTIQQQSIERSTKEKEAKLKTDIEGEKLNYAYNSTGPKTEFLIADHTEARVDSTHIENGLLMLARTFKVDFGDVKNNKLAKDAQKKVGLNQILPPEVSGITVTNNKGTTYNAKRDAQGIFIADNGNRMEALNGYKVKVMQVGDQRVAGWGDIHHEYPEDTDSPTTARADAGTAVEPPPAETTVDDREPTTDQERAEMAEQEMQREKAYEKESALWQTVEGNNIIEDFRTNKHVRIPEELRGLKAQDYGRDFIYMHHGAEVFSALKDLNKFAGKQSETQLWEVIRGRNLAKEEINLNEISTQVLGKGCEKVYAEFSDLRVKVMILDIKKIGEKQKKTDKTELYNFIRDQLKTRSPDQKALDKNMAILRGMKGVIINDEDPRPILDEYKNTTDFMAAASKLMKEIPNLKPKPESEKVELSTLEIQGLDEIEKVAKVIFPDYADKGPEAKRNWLQKLFGTGKHDLDMQTAYQGGSIEDDLQRSITGESAYIQLLSTALVTQPDGSLIVDKEKFENELDRLRKTGIEHVGESGNKELIELWTRNKERLGAEKFDMNAYDNLDIDLIRYGLRVDLNIKQTMDSRDLENPFAGLNGEQRLLMEKVILAGHNLSKEQLQEVAENIKELDREEPAVKAIMEQIVLSGAPLTNRQFKEVAGNIEKKIANDIKIKEKEFGYIGPSVDKTTVYDKRKHTDNPRKSESTELGLAIGDTFNAGHGIVVSYGLSGNVFSGSISFDTSIMATQKLGKHAQISEYAGASASKEGIQAGVGIGFTLALDKYADNNLVAGTGVGLSTNPMEILMFALGYHKDLNGTYERKEQEIIKDETISEVLDEQLQAYKEKIKDAPQDLQDRLIWGTMQFIEQNRKSEATGKMPDFVISDAGVAYIPPAIFVPYLKIGIRGKNDEIIYTMPDTVSGDERAEKQIRDQIASKVGPGVFKAGNLQITPDGTRTISEAECKRNQLDAKNVELGRLGLQIVPILNEEKEVRYRLIVTKAHGNVDIYFDSDSNIEGQPGDRGEVILNLMNLDEAASLSVRRVDELNSISKFGGVYNSKIYISNNIHLSNEVIEHRSPKIIHFEADLIKGQIGSAEEIERKSGKSTVAGSEAEAIESGMEVGHLYDDIMELQEAGVGMSEALRSQKYETGMLTERKTAMEESAQILIDNPKLRLDYKKLSVEMNDKALAELINENLPEDKKPKTNQETTYLRQALMVKSLAQAPQDEKFVDHIRNWNQQALERQLKAKGMKPDLADKISNKIMDFYADSLKEKLKAGGSVGTGSAESILEGSIVQIQVGTEKIEGYREMFFNNLGEGRMIGTLDLTIEKLKTFNLKDDEAKAFIEAVTERLSPLSEKPEKLIKSQLGLSVLSGADIIFGAEKCVLLTEIVKNSTLATDEKHRAVWQEFHDLVFELRNKGKVEKNGLLLNVDTTKQMGFYDACRNFTLVMNEELTITVPSKVAGTEVREYINGERTAHYTKVGFAVKIHTQEKTLPPKEPEPEPEEPEVEKFPGGFVKPGQVIPEEIRGAADQGHGSEVPPE